MTDSVGGSDAPDRDDPVLVELFEEYANRLQAGQPVDLESLAREHPDRADQIRQFLPAIKMLADIGDPGKFNGLEPGTTGVEGLVHARRFSHRSRIGARRDGGRLRIRADLSRPARRTQGSPVRRVD